MSWTDDFIDIPFLPNGRDRNGLDCWGLIYLVYKERLNIELPQYKDIFIDQSIASLKKVAHVMRRERGKWQKVDIPKENDMIMLRTGKYTWHVGIVIDRRNMLHIMSGIDSVVEEFTGIQWKNRIEEYRHYAR